MLKKQNLKEATLENYIFQYLLICYLTSHCFYKKNGIRWCRGSAPPPISTVNRFKDDENCGLLIYALNGFYFYETQYSGKPNDPNENKYVCVNYEELSNCKNCKNRINSDELLALIER